MIKRVFDSGNPNWDKDKRINEMFIKTQEDYANELLSYQGYLLLSKVYDDLGIPLTKKEELTAGWTEKDGPIRFNPDFFGPDAELEFDVKDITDYFED